ncbi:sphinganine-1-phosphate aldolase [Flagelloscypha sp. PMI_526]|nr:sphinganine-1-phosphate aldolase [Flagelloscypha sp. PMI_526]
MWAPPPGSFLDRLNKIITLIRLYGLAVLLLKAFRHRVFKLVLLMPSVRKKVEAEMGKAKLDIETKLVPKGEHVVRHLSLPEKGLSLDEILGEMDKMDNEAIHASDWRHGKLSGAVYHGGPDLEEIIVAAYKRYAVSNPLHPDVFPAVRKMEAEIVAQTLRLFNNPNGAGVVTSGGTESIIMAVKTHQAWAKATKGITEPEIVIPISAHAAFDKAAAYFKIKVHTIPVHPTTRRVDVNHVKRAINPNTIMLVGSAVNFPDGNQDDIEALGKLALKYKIGLHVDCCLGSFIVPYLEKAGLADGGPSGRYKLDPFDFRVPGVTSISCDTHKYGFAPKGTSVVMYKDADLRRHQYYVNSTWVGGVYASPSIAGSRPGALIAGAWATMQHIGSDGYLESCRSIVSCARDIADTVIATIPELYILGTPPSSVIAFGSKHPNVNILEVGDAMAQRGWHLNALSNPPAFHLACTRLTTTMVDSFIADLKDAVRQAKLNPSGKGHHGLGQSSAVGPSMVGELATGIY